MGEELCLVFCLHVGLGVFLSFFLLGGIGIVLARLYHLRPSTNLVFFLSVLDSDKIKVNAY
jgi:hypothetical protein